MLFVMLFIIYPSNVTVVQVPGLVLFSCFVIYYVVVDYLVY